MGEVRGDCHEDFMVRVAPGTRDSRRNRTWKSEVPLVDVQGRVMKSKEGTYIAVKGRRPKNKSLGESSKEKMGTSVVGRSSSSPSCTSSQMLVTPYSSTTDDCSGSADRPFCDNPTGSTSEGSSRYLLMEVDKQTACDLDSVRNQGTVYIYYTLNSENIKVWTEWDDDSDQFCTREDYDIKSIPEEVPLDMGGIGGCLRKCGPNDS